MKMNPPNAVRKRNFIRDDLGAIERCNPLQSCGIGKEIGGVLGCKSVFKINIDETEQKPRVRFSAGTSVNTPTMALPFNLNFNNT